MTLEEEIIKVLEDVRDRIRQNMEDKGENATGRTSLSWRVRKDGTKIQLVGGGTSSAWGGKTAPIESLEIGREAGGEWKELRPIIVKWTRDKEMDFENESHRWAVSTIIAKKITEQGTIRHYQNEDIYSSEVKKAVPIIRAICGRNLLDMMQTAIHTNTNI